MITLDRNHLNNPDPDLLRSVLCPRALFLIHIDGAM